jgi:kinetochore protein Spc24
MAKAISECEALLTNKEAELAALKEEARRLESYDPAVEHGKELDGTVYVTFPCPLFMCAECQT